MPDWLQPVLDSLTQPPLTTILRTTLIVLGTLFLTRTFTRRLTWRRLDGQQLMLARRVISTVIVGSGAFLVLNELGIGIGPLLGAAGLFTVAIGFASQTSMSNVISGLFLIGERPFVVGDLVEVDTTRGFVVSIELLSIKLRTLDNLMVRIPNETMLKSNVTNYTHFPIRRVDLMVAVAYGEDLERVKDVLFEVAGQASLALVEPEPLFVVKGMASSSIDLQLSVWCLNQDFLKLKNELYDRVQRAFVEHDIEIPFPHLSLYAGKHSEALPVRMVSDATEDRSPRVELA